MMLLKPQVSYTKALVVALLACWAIAEATRDGADGSVLALDSLNTNATYKSIPVKRNWKANAAIITSKPSSTVEERTTFDSIATALKETSESISQNGPAKLMQMPKSPRTDRLSKWYRGPHSVRTPRKNGGRLSQKDLFTKWYRGPHSVRTPRKNRGHPLQKGSFKLEEWYKLFFNKNGGDAGLIDTAHTAKEFKDWMLIAEKVLAFQIMTWIENKQSLESVFAMLQLDKTATDQLLVNPRSTQWFKLADAIEDPKKWEKVLSILKKKRDLGTLVKVLVEGPYNADKGTHIYAELLLREQLSKWKSNLKSEGYVFNFLTSLGPRSIESRYVLLWLDYMKLREMSRNEVLKVLQARFPNVDVAKWLEKPITESPVSKWFESWDNSVELPPHNF